MSKIEPRQQPGPQGRAAAPIKNIVSSRSGQSQGGQDQNHDDNDDERRSRSREGRAAAPQPQQQQQPMQQQQQQQQRPKPSSAPSQSQSQAQPQSHSQPELSFTPNRFSAAFPQDALSRWSNQFWGAVGAGYEMIQPWLLWAWNLVTFEGRLWGWLLAGLSATAAFMRRHSEAISAILSTVKSVLFTLLGLAIIAVRAAVGWGIAGYQAMRGIASGSGIKGLRGNGDAEISAAAAQRGRQQPEREIKRFLSDREGRQQQPGHVRHREPAPAY